MKVNLDNKRIIFVFSLIGILVISNTTLQSFAEDEWKIYQLTVQDQVFKVPYRINGGNIEQIQIQYYNLVIVLNSNSDGLVELSIPRNLFDESYEQSDDPFFVILDGSEVEYEETGTNSCYRTIAVKFLSGSKSIEFAKTVSGNTVRQTYVPPIQLFSSATYHAGETINIQGCTSLALDEGNVRIDVLEQQARVYKTLSVTPQIDGTFSTSFIIDDNANPNVVYTIAATYGNYTAVPEFSGIGLIILATALSVVLVTRLIPKISVL